MSERGSDRKRLLLHVCCGPCAAFPLLANVSGSKAAPPNEALPLAFLNGYSPPPPIDDIGWLELDITGLFYNPNIHPPDEFRKRMDGAKELFAHAGRPLIIRDDYMQREWEAFENANYDRRADEKKYLRCEMCYRTRLEYTAKNAREAGFGAFSTTLLISPYQDHDLIASICEELAMQYQIDFYYTDWRPYFREGQKLARESGLYRQKYCGCILSAPGRSLF